MERIKAMKKTLKSRLLSGVTAALLAITTSLGSFTIGSFMSASADTGGGGDTSAGVVFEIPPSEYGRNDWDPSTANKINSAAEAYLKLEFDDGDGTASVSLANNTYYLLVEASQKYNENYFGQSALIPLQSMGGISLWQSSQLSNYGFTTDANGVLRGTLLKNSNAWTALTLENAKSGTNCTPVDNIEGYKISKVSKLSTYSTYTNLDNVVMKAVNASVYVNVNVYDEEGNSAVVENSYPSKYYVLATITDRTTNEKAGWAIKQIDLEKNPSETVGFTSFYPFGEDGSTTTGTMIKYDPDKY